MACSDVRIGSTIFCPLRGVLTVSVMDNGRAHDADSNLRFDYQRELAKAERYSAAEKASYQLRCRQLDSGGTSNEDGGGDNGRGFGW